MKCLRILLPILAVLSAGVSAYFAGQSSEKSEESFEYIKQINKSSVSLQDVVIQDEVISEDSLQIKYLFNLQIIGNEPLNIINIATSHFNFKNNQYTSITDSHSILNKLFPDVIFNHPITLIINNMKELDKTKINQWFNMALIIRIDFKTPTNKDHVIYYMKFDNTLEVHHLSRKEYDIMESFLPVNFRFDESYQ